ncbi:GNAT family N-acetyltransferase [Chitinimonas sp.]|uniref:GNAT family N-acetyltransferase n=1 Tax=Chitinimonas sp. TaxID=1934313 RepID=UPI002F92A091
MAIEYRDNCEGLSREVLEALFQATELGGRLGDKILRAFLQSSHVCLAYDGERLVGVSRALCDGEYHGLIYDVAVHPDYQRQGIGRQMLTLLLAAMPVWRVMLVADEGVQPFYRQAGFEPYPDVLAKLTQDYLYN